MSFFAGVVSLSRPNKTPNRNRTTPRRCWPELHTSPLSNPQSLPVAFHVIVCTSLRSHHSSSQTLPVPRRLNPSSAICSCRAKASSGSSSRSAALPLLPGLAPDTDTGDPALPLRCPAATWCVVAEVWLEERLLFPSTEITCPLETLLDAR